MTYWTFLHRHPRRRFNSRISAKTGLSSCGPSLGQRDCLGPSFLHKTLTCSCSLLLNDVTKSCHFLHSVFSPLSSFLLILPPQLLVRLPFHLLWIAPTASWVAVTPPNFPVAYFSLTPSQIHVLKTLQWLLTACRIRSQFLHLELKTLRHMTQPTFSAVFCSNDHLLTDLFERPAASYC